jgi:hypothetical protein
MVTPLLNVKTMNLRKKLWSLLLFSFNLLHSCPYYDKKIQLSDQSMGKGATTWSKQGQWCKVEKIVQIPN